MALRDDGSFIQASDLTTTVDRALQFARDPRRNTMVEPRLAYVFPSGSVNVLSPPPSVKKCNVRKLNRHRNTRTRTSSRYPPLRGHPNKVTAQTTRCWYTSTAPNTA